MLFPVSLEMLTSDDAGAWSWSDVHHTAHLGGEQDPWSDHLPRSQLGDPGQDLAPASPLPGQPALRPRQHQGALPPHAHRPQEALHPHDHGRRVHGVQQEALHASADVRLPHDLRLLPSGYSRPRVQRDRVHVRPDQRHVHGGQRGGDQTEARPGRAGQVRDRVLQRPLHGSAHRPPVCPIRGVGRELPL